MHTNLVHRLLETRQSAKQEVASLAGQLAELKPSDPSHVHKSLQIIELLLKWASSTTLALIDEDELRGSYGALLADDLVEKLIGAASDHKTLELLYEALSMSMEAAATGNLQAANAEGSLAKAFAEVLLERIEADISALSFFLDSQLPTASAGS